MTPELHLAIHNVIMILSAIAFLGTAFFTYINGRKQVANITFSLLLVSGAVFCLSHMIGVSTSDPEVSRNIMMFNLTLFIGGMLQVHAALAIVGKLKEKMHILILFYVTGIACIIFFLIFPDYFLKPSVPKMYFPSYYVPGELNLVRLIYLEVLAIPYSIYLLLVANRASKSELERKKYQYIALSMSLAYLCLFPPNFLVYNINIDPLWLLLFIPGFVLPFMYGSIKYGMFSIKVIAKQAAAYSFAVVIVGGIIILLNYSDSLLHIAFPNYPVWATALISSLLAVTLAAFIWRDLRQSDILKYEFITTVTHKFRTPLTHIKWASENISKAKSLDEVKEQLQYIQDANSKLVDLTDILVQTSGTDTNDYNFRIQNTDLSDLVNDTIRSQKEQVQLKKLIIKEDIDPDLTAKVDSNGLKFVIQVLLENAVDYTPNEGTIDISLKASEKDTISFGVKDTGVGLDQEEIPKIFSKFYRGRGARSIDTEGMGIGLYMAREIILRHGGKMYVDSAGIGKGSTFGFIIPKY